MTNVKAAQQPQQTSQFENLRTLKSGLIPQIVDFCQTLKTARQKLDDIGFAIEKKQAVLNQERVNREEEEAKLLAEKQEALIKKEEEKVEETLIVNETKQPTKLPTKEEGQQMIEKTLPKLADNLVESESQVVKKEKRDNTVFPAIKTAEQVKPTEAKNFEQIKATEAKKPEKQIKPIGKPQQSKPPVPLKKVTETEKTVAGNKIKEKTYTDEKGNVKVRRFITDFNNRYASNTKPKSRTDTNRPTQRTQRTGSGTFDKNNSNYANRGSQPVQRSGDNRFTKPNKPAFSTAFVPKAPTKSYGNKNKSPNKPEDKRVAANKRQLLMRTFNTGLDEDDEALLAKRPRGRRSAEKAPTVIKVIDHAVITTQEVQIKVLSEKTGISVAQIIKSLFKEGIVKTINDTVDYEIAAFITAGFNVELEYKPEITAEEQMIATFDNQDLELTDDEKRPPIVTVMGHVDHGKTSLLDSIRNTSVTTGEAGGITQHIGAYTVKVKGETITFIDTPGHAAFTSMRARGAKVTDVAIIVVAADDGVMPQTIEAISHAKAAEVAIIVAINKMDKAEAKPDRIKQQLMEHGLVPEEWGGDTIMVPVSAKKGDGLDALLESILTVTEIKELKANSKKRASGTIIEAKLDKGRGPVATVLIKNGTLSIGDYVIAGTITGKIRAMFDDKGRRVTSAGPSYPVEVLGFDDVPLAGDLMHAGDEKNIKDVSNERKAQERESIMATGANVSLGDLFSKISEGELKTLNLIIKTDVQGSLEALKISLEKISNDEVKVTSIHGGVGAINETDVMLAKASNAIIIGFNVRPDANAKSVAEKEGVDIKLYRIIYDAVDDVTKAMKGMLAPKYQEEILGQVTVRDIFKISGVGTIAGCYVNSGKITRDSKVRLYRNNVLVTDCDILTLKRFKDDVKEVATGYECGVSLNNYNDIKVDDVFEVYRMKEIQQ